MRKVFLLISEILFSICVFGQSLPDTIFVQSISDLDLSKYARYNKTLVIKDTLNNAIETGELRNGKRNGTWITYRNGKRESLTNFIEGSKESCHIIYYSNGKMKLYENYYNNTLYGISCEFMPDGHISRINNYNYLNKGNFDLKQRFVFNDSNQIEMEFINMTVDSALFTNGACGDGWSISEFIMEDSTILCGNKWYDNGNPNLIIIPRKQCEAIIYEITKYSKDGRKLYQGSYKYVCYNNICCWEKQNDWIYFSH